MVKIRLARSGDDCCNLKCKKSRDREGDRVEFERFTKSKLSRVLFENICETVLGRINWSEGGTNLF